MPEPIPEVSRRLGATVRQRRARTLETKSEEARVSGTMANQNWKFLFGSALFLLQTEFFAPLTYSFGIFRSVVPPGSAGMAPFELSPREYRRTLAPLPDSQTL